MRLLFPSLLLLLLLLPSPFLPCFRAQSSDAAMLDSLLQHYAYMAFLHPLTGVIYNATVPSNFTGIKLSALRLKTGSLLKRGVDPYYDFKLPKGVVVHPYVERLVLVYQNLGRWSTVYYPPPPGFTYLAPVLGLLAYDARNLSATNLPQLDLTASRSSITVNFLDVKRVPDGSTPKCVWFDLQGNVNFSNVVSKHTCSTTKQGHFALVVKAIAPSPAPSPVTNKEKKKKTNMNMKRLWIIVGIAVGGILILVLLGMLLVCSSKYQRRNKMAHMEKASEVGEALRMTSVGSAKAPAAMVTRTQPTLETEYAP